MVWALRFKSFLSYFLTTVIFIKLTFLNQKSCKIKSYQANSFINDIFIAPFEPVVLSSYKELLS